jgi:arginyl-tRNA synthetase
MNVFSHFEARIAAAIETLKREGVLSSPAEIRRFTVERPRAGYGGDLVANAALAMAGPVGMKPRELAGRLAAVLAKEDGVGGVEVTGPGFISLTLTTEFWAKTLRAILLAGAEYGRPPARPGKRISIAFIPFCHGKSLTSHQIRAAAYGDALANLLAFAGRDVTREPIADPCAADLLHEDLTALAIHQDFLFRKQFHKESANQRAVDISARRGDLHAGCEVDDASIKSHGEISYFVLQLASHRQRLIRGRQSMIAVACPPPHVPAKAIRSAISMLTESGDAPNVKFCSPMRLLRAGSPMEQTEYSGSGASGRNLMDYVGRDAARFTMLFRPSDETVDFDLANVVDQSWDNPAFYVQYAHARACAALRDLADAPRAGEKYLHTVYLRLLTDDAELSVIKRISQFPRVIESAAEGHEPHRIALFLYELARDFHVLWNRSKESPQLRFKVPHDCELRGARTALLVAIVQTMQTGLGLLGVKAVVEMR